MKWNKENIIIAAVCFLIAAAVLAWAWTRPEASVQKAEKPDSVAEESPPETEETESKVPPEADETEPESQPETEETEPESPPEENALPEESLYLPEGPKEPETTAEPVKTTTESALRAALAHAGLSGAEADGINTWIEYENGAPVCYEVRFQAGETAYAYEIGLKDSRILSWQQETSEPEAVEPEEETPARRPDIGEAKARAAALSHAGLREADARWVRVRKENGVYKVSFQSGNKDFSYEIDPKSGEVLTSGVD